MADQTARLEAATLRAEIGSGILFRFSNDTLDGGAIPTQSGDIDNLKKVILDIRTEGANKISFATTIYATTAAGIAATANGAIFLVRSNSANEIYAVYSNNNGTAVDTGKRALSSQAVQDATTSATNAAASAQTAANTATARVAGYHSPSASDPTTRDDGSALQQGDTYFNTSTNTSRVYSASGWILASVNGNDLSSAIATREPTIAAGTAGQFLGADKTFQTPTKSNVGLANVDNTSDASKPVSTAQAAAIGLKANANNPTFTGTVNGITKAMIGLSAVDNTSDLGKPVSTAQQAAIAIKASSSDLAASSGAALLGYVQALSNAVPRTVALKISETIDLEDFGPVDRTGATDMTTILNRAMASCTEVGRKLRLPAGVLLVDAPTVPAMFKGLVGAGKSATVLRFVRRTYATGSVLFNAQNLTASPEFSDFTIDCDDAAFKVSGLAVFPHTGSDNIILNNVRILGRGDSAFVSQGTKNGRAYNLTVDCTGNPGATFNTPFYGENCSDYLVVGMRVTGRPTYCGAFGVSSNCKFVACHGEGTSGSFGWSHGTSTGSHILDCTLKNSSHEAFQLTDCNNCIVALNSALWDASYGAVSGQDAGISIHGKSSTARLNLVVFNTLTNSFAAGIMAADNSAYNTFAFNTLKDCGVRGTASGTGGTNACAMGQYTALANQSCLSNRFIENLLLSEAGTTTYGYGEFNQGSGSSITNTTLRHNEFYGSFTTRYLAPSASKRIWDIDALAFVPVVGVTGTGSITASTLNSASFRRDGDYIDMNIDLTITSVSGTITGLLLTWAATAPLPALYQGAFTGIDITNGYQVGGVPSGSGVVIRKYDASNPAIAGARIAITARYRTL